MRLLLLREFLGIALILLAWFNPFSLGFTVQLLLFILGFDAISLAPKLAIFAIDLLIGFSGLGWTLIILMLAEIIATFILLERAVKLIVKPLAVFVVGFLALGLQPALIAAGIDLILNLVQKRKYKRKR